MLFLLNSINACSWKCNVAFDFQTLEITQIESWTAIATLVLCPCYEAKKNRINTHTHFWETLSLSLCVCMCASIVFTCPNKAIHVCNVIVVVVVVAQIQFQKWENAKSKQKPNDFQFIDCDVACRMAMMLNEIHIKKRNNNFSHKNSERESLLYDIWITCCCCGCIFWIDQLLIG